MAKKLFKITSYHLTEDMPTQYPIPLRIEECEVNSHEKVNDFRNNACATTPASDDGGFFCMRVQEYEKNESGGLMYRDDEIRMGTHPYYTYGCYDDSPRFSYGDIVEVIDGDTLTLGIIIHVPRALREQRLIIVMPSWYYKYDVMVYKADGTVSHMELTEAQMIHGRGIIARPIIKALKESMGTVCVRE